MPITLRQEYRRLLMHAVNRTPAAVSGLRPGRRRS
jgi:hypothetical protein